MKKIKHKDTESPEGINPFFLGVFVLKKKEDS